MKIDAHHHLWDQSVRPQGWMDDATQVAIGGPYSLQDWAAAAEPSGVTHGVFVQTVPDPAETPDVLALAATDPRLAAVVGWIDVDADPRPAGEQLDALITGPGGEYLAGVRVAAEYSADPDSLDSPPIHALARALAGRDLALDLLLTPANLGAAERLAAANPETRMVINHLAKPTMREADFRAWADDIAAFTAHEHVACKLSGFLTFDALTMTADRLAPYAGAALATFGPARMMFGSDWPVSILGGGYGATVSIAEQIIAPLSEGEQAAIWAGTACSWYRGLAAAIDGSLPSGAPRTNAPKDHTSTQRIS